MSEGETTAAETPTGKASEDPAPAPAASEGRTKARAKAPIGSEIADQVDVAPPDLAEPVLTQAEPTRLPETDDAGRPLDEWGLPYAGPARVEALAGRVDPRADSRGWERVDGGKTLTEDDNNG